MSRSFFAFFAFFAFLAFACFFGLVASCSNAPTKPKPANSLPKTTASPTVEQSNQQQQTVGLTPPEIVRSEEVRIEGGLKTLTVGNSQGHYHLSCNVTLDSCVTPVPGKDYLVFSKTTRWQFPGATKVATLEFFQEFSVTYNNQDNIALIPAEQSSAAFGMYALESWEKNP